jgi:KipI family sensor histidine kinase inhibitor
VTPLIRPLGDSALLVRFGDSLDDAANRAAIAFAARLDAALPAGVLEIAPGLVSVLLRFDPVATDGETLAGELRLMLLEDAGSAALEPREHVIPVSYGGGNGPDLDDVAAALKTTPDRFVRAHNLTPLRVLAIGFAPGFAYCGFHPEVMRLPRRREVRPRVPAGTILFAAGQTAIAATEVPTGWHVIGRTDLSNFEPDFDPPVTLRPGDRVRFEDAE